MTNYEFTFKTNSEYLKARLTGYIPEYKCVRLTVMSMGSVRNFPVHSEEEFHDMTERFKAYITDIYPSTTFYEWDE